jgi:pyruvate,water dikinase
MLQRLAAGCVAPDDFLRRFGHRGAGEMELANARWREDASLLFRLSGSRPTDGQLHLAGKTRRFGNAPPIREANDDWQQSLRDLLAAEGASSYAEPLLGRCALVRQLLPYREAGKDAWMRGYELLREVIQELGRRWELGEDIYFLTLEHLRDDSPARWRDEARARRETWQALQRVALPDIIDFGQLDRLLDTPAPDAGAAGFRGTPLSAGTARGPALRREGGDAGLLPAVDPPSTGYVLVCRTVDPALTPWLLGACGLVVQRGGVLSHGALVARQMGIPAVACSQALELVETGTIVRIDGDQGLVHVEQAQT